MTLEGAAVLLNAHGYLVNNAFQIGGAWRVNVRAEDWQTRSDAHEFAEGPTLALALKALFEKLDLPYARDLEDALDTLAEAIARRIAR